MADGPGSPRFFDNPDITAAGAPRASVAFTGLKTLWVNTGTLCNIECAHCYIESSPSNDRLVYLTAEDFAPHLDDAIAMGASEIGFTGGEPFLNPECAAMAERALSRGLNVLILTNAMRPMMRPAVREALITLRDQYGAKLSLRVSLDHFAPALHDEERGRGAFDKTMAGLAWLDQHGFSYSIAARLRWGDDEATMRAGFERLCADRGFSLNAQPTDELIVFPEMDETAPVPEITTECWEILGRRPDDMMCASARMLIKRKGAAAPTLLACTLLAYDEAFEMGQTLDDAVAPVKLNHPHCAKFCVLGGARCSG